MFTKTLVFLLCPLWLLAQSDSIGLTSVDLDAVTISEERQGDFSNSLPAEQHAHQSLSQLLPRHSSTYVKNYGRGSLATLSLRGGTANQTTITWEGMDINNPMTGLKDLSIIPLQLFDKVELIKGGQSAGFGSGAMTGRINLTNEMLDSIRDQGRLELGVSSFGGGAFSLSKKKKRKQFQITFNGSLERSENDFPYKIGNEEKRLSNAEFQSASGLIKLENTIKRQHFSVSIWGFVSGRGIPPTTTQVASTAYQGDRFLRTAFRWNYLGERYSIKSTLGITEESNSYEASNSTKVEPTTNKFKKLIHLSELHYQLPNEKLILKTELTNVEGESGPRSGYSNSRKTGALYVGWEKEMGKLIASLGVRKEINNFNSPPLIPHLSFGFLNGPSKIDLKLSREYRNPTLNDLYWNPGGDATLEAEQGWNQELSFSHKNNIGKISLDVFHRKIDNWLQWLPQAGTILWSAQNLASVRSMGLEVDFKKTLHFHRISGELSSGYAYIRSTYLDKLPGVNLNAGDQLFYTPRHRGYLSGRMSIGNIYSGATISFTDKVKGINENPGHYTLADCFLGFQNRTKKNKLRYIPDVLFSINNLTNKNYRIVERRPQPGRNYSLTLRFKIEKQK